jgi:hypothetical protein
VALTGLIPLTVAQAAIEATKGTILPATRKQPILDGYLEDHMERQKVVEQRGSFIRNYRSYQIKRHVEISGLTFAATYEDLPWLFQFFLKGGVTGGAGDGGTPAMYSYGPFSPTAASDDLKTCNWELGDDTQNFSIPYCVGNKLQLGFTREGPMTTSTDWLGARAVKQAKTGSLSDRVTEDIIGSDGIVYIDSTTIGTTAVAYPLSMNLTIDNNFNQLWVLDGNKYPKEAYRGQQRMMAMEMVIAFDTTAEYDAFLTSPAERKIRYRVNGTTIHNAITKQLTIDWYGYWDEAAFGSQNGMRIITLRGESHYDTGASLDWSATVQNALSTLP